MKRFIPLMIGAALVLTSGGPVSAQLLPCTQATGKWRFVAMSKGPRVNVQLADRVLDSWNKGDTPGRQLAMVRCIHGRQEYFAFFGFRKPEDRIIFANWLEQMASEWAANGAYTTIITNAPQGR